MTLTLPDPLELPGDDFRLRPWAARDLDALVAIETDPLIVQWNPLSKPDDPVDAWLQRRSAWTDHASWAVVDATDHLIGSVSLFQFDATNSNCMLGYWTAPAFRGRGHAPRAARLAAAYAFTSLGIERVAVFHAVENEPSCRVAVKAGFAYEGTARLGWRYPDGELHDEHVHAMVRADLG